MAYIAFPDDARDWRILKNAALQVLNRLMDTPDDIGVYDPHWAKQHDPVRLGVEHVAMPFEELHHAKLFVDLLEALAKEHGIQGGSQGVPAFEYRPIDQAEAGQVRALQAEGLLPRNITPKATVIINGYPKLMPTITQLRQALFFQKTMPGVSASPEIKN